MNFNQYQYEDLKAKECDPYANAKYEIILKLLNNQKNLNILNAGCGSGELSLLLAAAGHNVIGFDPSPEYIALAKNNYQKKFVGQCTFVVSDIASFESDNQFDCVVATDVLEHIKDDLRANQKLVKLLKNGGQLIITVPALEQLFGYHDELIGHFRRYTKTTLSALMEKSGGLSVTSLRYFGFTLIPVCYWFSKLKRKSYPLTSDPNSSSLKLRNLILRLMLMVDRAIVFPLGISLICSAKKYE